MHVCIYVGGIGVCVYVCICVYVHAWVNVCVSVYVFISYIYNIINNNCILIKLRVSLRTKTSYRLLAIYVEMYIYRSIDV